jgi:hypothetical protein
MADEGQAESFMQRWPNLAVEEGLELNSLPKTHLGHPDCNVKLRAAAVDFHSQKRIAALKAPQRDLILAGEGQ